MITNIQFLRFIAASSIVFCHIILWGNDRYGLNAPSLSSITDYLMIGVDVFFVISGFIMVVTTYDKQVNIWSFLKKRALRIYPVYWFLCILLLPIFFLKPEWINSGATHPTSLLHSLLLIPHEGSPLIMVAWTLEFEVFFYLIFGLTLFLSKIKQIVFITLAFTLTAVYGAFNAPPNALTELLTSSLLLEFALGMWLGVAHKKHLLAHKNTAIVIAATILALIPYVASFKLGEIDRFIHFAPIAACILALAVCLSNLNKNTHKKLSIIGGDISYALYLVHVLTLVAVGRIGLMVDMNNTAPISLAIAMALVSLIAAVVITYPRELLNSAQSIFYRRSQKNTINVEHFS